jgi:hypothetical protein
MQRILSSQAEIYNELQRSAGPKFFFQAANASRYAACYTCLFLIADTGDSLMYHRQKDFSPDQYASYLEFWGVMQAIIIQQDAICELHEAIVESAAVISQASAWCRLREFRNRTAGHPANRSRGVPAPQRTFMGRTGRTYSCVQYELWDAHTGARSHPVLDLGLILDDYDIEASAILDTHDAREGRRLVRPLREGRAEAVHRDAGALRHRAPHDGFGGAEDPPAGTN